VTRTDISSWVGANTFQEQDMQTLVQLGCTLQQAKVYLNLAKLETAKATDIANLSKVPRQEVYRLLFELQDLGLIEKIIAVPTKYRAIQIEDGLTILMDRKNKELSELRKNACDLIDKLKDDYLERPHKDLADFVLIPEREALVLKLKNAIQNACESIDAMCTLQSLSQGLFSLSGIQTKPVSQNLKVRVITNQALNEATLQTFLQSQFFNPEVFHHRIITAGSLPKFAIFDNCQVFIGCSLNANFADDSALWANSTNLVRLVQDYFGRLWVTAMSPVDRLRMVERTF
jgi:sugar-specific transcriptional regulator TrmB